MGSWAIGHERRSVRRGTVEFLGLWSEVRHWSVRVGIRVAVSEGNIDLEHGHLRIDLSEQLHQDAEADAGGKHFCLARRNLRHLGAVPKEPIGGQVLGDIVSASPPEHAKRMWRTYAIRPILQ